MVVVGVELAVIGAVLVVSGAAVVGVAAGVVATAVAQLAGTLMFVLTYAVEGVNLSIVMHARQHTIEKSAHRLERTR